MLRGCKYSFTVNKKEVQQSKHRLTLAKMLIVSTLWGSWVPNLPRLHTWRRLAINHLWADTISATRALLPCDRRMCGDVLVVVWAFMLFPPTSLPPHLVEGHSLAFLSSSVRWS